ncbi:MAG: nitroreductase family protein [Deltaproteobacteria bacterium]|jgi:nitroreductase|nr:nitroreductase family protein [Deltaproteobacteria bacterium]
MTDFFELTKIRQSCRDYSDQPVEREKLVKCLEAARLTPSGCNSQPWSVVAVDDPKIAAEVAKTTAQLGVNEYIAKAKAFFIILEERAKLMPAVARILDSQYWAKGDLGAFTYALTLQAQELGLGTCILGVFDRPKLREILKIDNEKPIFMVVAVGYPADPKIRNKQRKNFDELVRFV